MIRRLETGTDTAPLAVEQPLIIHISSECVTSQNVAVIGGHWKTATMMDKRMEVPEKNVTSPTALAVRLRNYKRLQKVGSPH